MQADEVGPEVPERLPGAPREPAGQRDHDGDTSRGAHEILHRQPSHLREIAHRVLARVGLPVGVRHERHRRVHRERERHIVEVLRIERQPFWASCKPSTARKPTRLKAAVPKRIPSTAFPWSVRLRPHDRPAVRLARGPAEKDVASPLNTRCINPPSSGVTRPVRPDRGQLGADRAGSRLHLPRASASTPVNGPALSIKKALTTWPPNSEWIQTGTRVAVNARN